MRESLRFCEEAIISPILKIKKLRPWVFNSHIHLHMSYKKQTLAASPGFVFL